MNLRLLNLLVVVGLLVVGLFNLNVLVQPWNDAFGWRLYLPLGSTAVTQEFRYRAPAAGEVHLVWGQAGWQQMPDTLRPPGTALEFGILNTPMQRVGDTFTLELRLPVGTHLDYGFQTRSLRDRTSIEWVWDGDYAQFLTTDNQITIDAHGLLAQGPGAAQPKSTVLVTPQWSPLWRSLLPAMPWLATLSESYGASPLAPYLPFGFLGAGILLLGGGAALLIRRWTGKRPRRQGALRDWIYLRDLLRELVGRELKLRYRRSLLGIGWSLINPLLQLLIFGFVFRYVLPLSIPNYSLFLFSGLLIWNWLQGSLMGATTAIIDGGSLLKHPNFPATILPVATVAANFIHFLLALPILFGFLWFSGAPMTGALWALPAIMALQFLFTLSLAFFLATVHVALRDTQHLVVVLLLLFFYLTPIFYDGTMIPANFQGLYQLNPVTRLMQAYRAVLLHGEFPTLAPLLGLTVCSSLLLFWGWQLFRRASYQFVEEL